MVLGFGPIGSSPLSALPDDFRVAFDVDRVENGSTILQVVSFLDLALIKALQRQPDDLRTIDRRRFEELVAELFSGFGYEVELTQKTRDGGKDIIAIRRREVETKLLIECKRPEPGNSVSVSVVRELLGVKTDEGASKAILATTTYLSSDAKALVSRHRWELEAREFDAIKSWIADYLRLRS